MTNQIEAVKIGIVVSYLAVSFWLIRDFGRKEMKTEKMETELMDEKEMRVNEAIFHGEFAFLNGSAIDDKGDDTNARI